MEVIVPPLADKRKQKREVDVDVALKNITGIIQDEGMSLDDYRIEKREKYVDVDWYERDIGRFAAEAELRVVQ